MSEVDYSIKGGKNDLPALKIVLILHELHKHPTAYLSRELFKSVKTVFLTKYYPVTSQLKYILEGIN